MARTAKHGLRLMKATLFSGTRVNKLTGGPLPLASFLTSRDSPEQFSRSDPSFGKVLAYLYEDNL